MGLICTVTDSNNFLSMYMEMENKMTNVALQAVEQFLTALEMDSGAQAVCFSPVVHLILQSGDIGQLL